MPGANQLPAGAEGAAALSLTYASISWICSALFIYIARLYREGLSYISILAYFTLLSTTASIIQQGHDVIWYKNVVTEQFERRVSYFVNAESAIANGSVGIDLVLYYIQYYSYSVEAMLVMFWAGELAQTVYDLSGKSSLKTILRRINLAGKWISVLFPLLTILLLRVPAIQQRFVIFILVADLPLMISLAIGSSTVVAILARYITTRKKLSNWTPERSGSNVASQSTGIQSTGTQSSTGKRTVKKQGLYDRWLMVRFTCAFFVLGLFEVTNTLFQLQSMGNNTKDMQATEPDLSVERARSTLFLFMPGVSPGIFVFLVFGTTAGCRKAMYDLFVPRRWRGQLHSPSGRGCGGCMFWRGGRRQAADRPPTGDAENLFAECDETERYSTSKGVGEQHVDLSKPLPVAPPLSRYNESYDADKTGGRRPRGISVESKSREDAETIQLRSLSSPSSVHDEYYQVHPEQSDDSGPILPIMRNDAMRGTICVMASPDHNTRRTMWPKGL